MTRDYPLSRNFASDLIRLNTYLMKETLSAFDREVILDKIRSEHHIYKMLDGSTIVFHAATRRFLMRVVP